MPFTLIHGAIAFFAVSLFTRDRRLWLIAFFAGMAPDIDGFGLIPDLLFGTDFFHEFHHELLHPLVYGVLFGAVVAFAVRKLWKVPAVESFAAFAFGFMLHSIMDVFFTDWYVRLFWPFYNEKIIFASLVQYNYLLWLAFPFMLLLPFAADWLFRMKK